MIAPSSYNIKAEIDAKKEKNGGWTFDESRGKWKEMGYLKHIYKEFRCILLIFKPGDYHNYLMDYTMRLKTANPGNLYWLDEYTTAK